MTDLKWKDRTVLIQALLVTFWAAAPKGRCPVEHRGGFRDVRPSFRPYFRPSVPPPVDHQGLKLALPGLKLAIPVLKLALQGLKLALPGLKLALSGLKLALPGLNLALQVSNQPLGFISAPHASNLPSRPQICPPALKSALQIVNQPSKHKTSPPNLKSALQALILRSIPQICLQWPKLAPQDGRTSRNPPCVLQDIGPLGPLPCSHSTSLLDHSQQGIGYR